MKERNSPPRPHRAMELASDLRMACRQLRHRLREQGTAGDLTEAQKAVLRHLERAPSATVSALARAEGVRPQSMGATVAALQAAGLVEGRPDPGDGRQTRLQLSEACRKRLVDNRAARQDWLANTIDERLSADERDRLADAIGLIRRIADP